MEGNARSQKYAHHRNVCLTCAKIKRTHTHTHKLKRTVVVFVVRRRRSFLLSSRCRSRRESSPSSTRCFLDEQRAHTRNAVGSFRRRRKGGRKEKEDTKNGRAKSTKTTKTKTRKKKIFLPPPLFHRSSRHRTNSTPRFLVHTTEKKEEI